MDEGKTRAQLIAELAELRRRITELEASETGCKQEEEALDIERRQLLSIFGSIDEVIYVSDPDTYEVLYVNQALVELFGDVIGQKCYRTFQNLESPCSFCTNKYILGENTGQPYIWEFQNRINRRWYRCIDKAIRWPDGRMVRYEMAVDITERKRVEETLKQRANQLALLNDVGGKIAAILKLNNILDRAAQLLQEGFGYHHVALFDIDREQGEVVMRAKAGDFAHLFPSDHRLKFRQGMVGWVGYYGKKLLANDVGAEPRYVNFYPGVIPTRSELSVPIGVAGEVVGVLDVQSPHLNAFNENDVMVMETLAAQIAVAIENARLYEAIEQELTKRKRMEEQLRRHERLAAVGQLAGGIAHDFNNLLATIILYAQMTLGERTLAPDVARALQTILNESKRAAKLVQQILDFSSRSMMTTKPVDLVSFTKEVVDVLRRTIPENIRLLLDAPSAGPEEYAAPLTVEADPTRIQQALMNLALNARDAMPEGGELRVGLSRVETRLEEEPPVAEMSPGAWICLSVSDTGTGITEEAQAHLFEPFFTTKPAGKGTGLGLAQVYGIVKQHKGHIGVETWEGEGTVFRIYLPAYQEEKKEMEEVKIEEPFVLPQGQGEIILFVEDEKRLQDAMRGILEMLGYRVLTASHGEEALEVYRKTKEKIDLVITDLVMPGIGGRQLIRELMRENPNLRALAITGHVMQADREALRDAGFLDVIYKPFDAGRLAKTVRHALDVD
jgi:signal transduction histidine kinase/CheY-like chemotaxis protein